MREREGNLFGHPLIIHLPCEAQGALYYSIISSVLAGGLANLQWTLCLTDAKV